MERKTVVNIS